MSKKPTAQHPEPATTPDAISRNDISPDNIPPNNVSPNNVSVDDIVTRVNEAQRAFANFTQQQVDAIFHAAAAAATAQRIHLARLAVQETGMGILEDKVIKNHFASEYIYNKYKDDKTCGVIRDDPAYGYREVAAPIGVIAGIIPTTNPTSTTIFKALLALKTRNGIIFAPHPRAAKSTVEAARIVHEAAVAAGAPRGVIGWVEAPTPDLTRQIMQHRGVALILATGGPGMVHAAYSSGKPAIGVGAGNTPVVMDATANVKMAVNSVILSKTFDNGMICASEQAVIVEDAAADAVKAEFAARGCHFATPQEAEALAGVVFTDGKLNAAIVGRSAAEIAAMAGITVPPTTKILIAERDAIDPLDPFAHEKLSPVLGFYRAPDFSTAVDMAQRLVELGGAGHTSVLYTDEANHERIVHFQNVLTTGRTLINMPSSQGAIGDVYNFELAPSLTLGCGSWGGNSVSENIGVKHLMNVKTVAERRENMLWFRVPPKIYFKMGALRLALEDMRDRKRAFIVTDRTMEDLGHVGKVTSVLEKLGIQFRVFSDVKPDPDLTGTYAALDSIRAFQPDMFIALGGGSPMDAAKIMWLMYEQPDLKFEEISLRFMDIRKRVYAFPELGKKAVMVAVPTTSGTGSEVTPFAVITDDVTGMKYPIADYALTPDMAIVDPEFVMDMPRTLTAHSGLDALTHAVEAFTSTYANNFSDGNALEAVRLVFKYLRRAYNDGARDVMAREKMHYAGTIAGMAFANAFLGVCHSMAHKLGAAFHMPHGLANALLLSHVIEYNATDTPTKQGLMPQYRYPFVKGRYARIADMLGLTEGCGDARDRKVARLVQAIEKLKTDLNVPGSLREAGIAEADFLAGVDLLAEQAFDDQCTGGNPRYPLIAEIRELYLKAYYGEPLASLTVK
ncbi:bifunctional acetaldehyde-CoA/alcohol dehydrogenase [Nitratidesulfovibrio termitidis]|uniref:bifunctional acetaldehyde-CoA/alcohol dehydrogenase n=1 Tax=Nitratidesulfovibrio termitidis TaxID=42252 RepID=UPI000416628E|nr:bifunctional acetaldehyde-CoA/alcohol dehydrogenase [Nitratidesulfovibrio termitidis]